MNNKKVITTALSLFLLFVSQFNDSCSYAYSIEDSSGFIDSYHGFSTNQSSAKYSNRVISRTRLRYQAWIPKDNSTSLTFSFNSTFDDLVKSNSSTKLRELFIDTSFRGIDIRFGRQFIIWGKMDGLAITDIICPRDYREFLSSDYDDTRLPVEALKATYSHNSKEWQFICIPEYSRSIFAPQNSRWAFKKDFPNNYETEQHKIKKPSMNFKNSKLGLKYSVFGNALDYSFSAFKTWDDNPLYITRIDKANQKLSIFPEAYKIMVLGAEMAKAKEGFVYRLESALHIGKKYASTLLTEDAYKKNDLNLAFGTDWAASNGIDVTGQLAYRKILDYRKHIKDRKESWLATLRVSKKLLRDSLKISSMNYIDLSNDSGFSRFSSDYALIDDVHLIIGSDIFYGRRGTFGQFRKNDNCWIEVKYIF